MNSLSTKWLSLFYYLKKKLNTNISIIAVKGPSKSIELDMKKGQYAIENIENTKII